MGPVGVDVDVAGIGGADVDVAGIGGVDVDVDVAGIGGVDGCAGGWLLASMGQPVDLFGSFGALLKAHPNKTLIGRHSHGVA